MGQELALGEKQGPQVEGRPWQQRGSQGKPWVLFREQQASLGSSLARPFPGQCVCVYYLL